MKIAVIGGGVAGIRAAHALDPGNEVHLFEADGRLGGHACTATVPDEDAGGPLDLDVAFLIFNSHTYPEFIAWISAWGLESAIAETEMSFSFSGDAPELEYAINRGFRGAFPGPRDVLSLRRWRLLAELRRFRSSSGRSGGTAGEGVSLDEHLVRTGASRLFRERFALPMTAAIWSLTSEDGRRFPADEFLGFLHNHRALKRERGAKWLTFRGGSRRYIDAFRGSFGGKVHLNAPVRSVVTAGNSSVRLVGDGGEIGAYDRVVIATHADTALEMLADPTPLERALLGAWEYRSTSLVLHRDPTQMPRNKSAWASWNLRTAVDGRKTSHQITYHLNRIQSLRSDTDYFATLNPRTSIARDSILREFSFRHPAPTAEAKRTQPELARLNEAGLRYFCGSYFGHGFHEDAVVSARRAAERLRASC